MVCSLKGKLERAFFDHGRWADRSMLFRGFNHAKHGFFRTIGWMAVIRLSITSLSRCFRVLSWVVCLGFRWRRFHMQNPRLVGWKEVHMPRIPLRTVGG